MESRAPTLRRRDCGIGSRLHSGDWCDASSSTPHHFTGFGRDSSSGNSSMSKSSDGGRLAMGLMRSYRLSAVVGRTVHPVGTFGWRDR